MFLLLVTVALVAAANASPTIRGRPMFPSGRIVGGDDAEIETFPYQVSLQTEQSHDCGGSIISKNHVLTAGHCVGAPAEELTVRAGSSKCDRDGSVHKVVEVIRHENYEFTVHGSPVNDIAIVKVEEPFEFDDTRQPIDLFEYQEETAPGVTSVITGWGNTDNGEPSQLQTVAIPIIDKEQCHAAYANHGGLPSGQICAAYYGVGGKDACQGDSGGPLAIGGRLAGIVSWGNGCAEPYFPGVYTEVAYFRAWINEQVPELVA